MNRIAALAFVGLNLLSMTVVRARVPTREVNVVVDMTPEGRKLEHPTPDKPAYYFPVIGGYKEMGALVAGEKPPTSASVIHIVAVELAKEGYLTCLHQVPATDKQPTHMTLGHVPSLLIVVHWGYMNPEIDDFGTDPSDPSGKTFFNENQMLSLVAGNTLNSLNLGFDREDIMQRATDDRYFIVISAYDAVAYFKQKKKISLWVAKMSVPSNGVDFGEVMTALVKAGGPLLGRETMRPKALIAPLTPEGHVEVGTPTVKDYIDASPPPPKPPKGAATTPTSTSQSPSPTTGTPPAHTPQ